jgi:HSP20 family molecular chaperone IbpA
MSNVAVQKVGDGAPKTLPIFEEIGKRLEEVRRRAAELFEQRGRAVGHALDDWLKAEREVFGGWPAAELKEKNEKYELEMTLPGYDAKEVEVTVTPQEILVHAESRHEKKGEEGKVVWSEFGSNSVYRRFELPGRIDVDKTHATLDKGLLRITAAKAASAKKQIPAAA